MSRRLLPHVLLVALAGCAHAPVRTPHPAPEREAEGRQPATFRVLTLNTAHGTVVPQLGAFIARETVAQNLVAIGRVLEREQADVVALQEVHRGTGALGLDHAARIAEVARYPHHFFGEHLPARAEKPAHGTALLSTLQLTAPASHTFGLQPDDDKGYVLATVAPPELGGVEVDVVSVHLDPYSDAKRIRQMDAMVRALSSRGRPLVVMGDFNTGWGREGGVHRLARRLKLRTYRPTWGERTFPVLLPISRMDWILISPELRFLGYRTLRDGVTDHCGVVAELGLVPGAVLRQRIGNPVLPSAASR
ncbi:MAG: endonuclease/exonuclease/phosphatase family protein [Myxococcaceae bacterium]|nr:endonuclease/exonuclease/phosphatase family protein [Myxococcaceae bacterium]